jgi:hypothetical protein
MKRAGPCQGRWFRGLKGASSPQRPLPECILCKLIAGFPLKKATVSTGHLTKSPIFAIFKKLRINGRFFS